MVDRFLGGGGITAMYLSSTSVLAVMMTIFAFMSRTAAAVSKVKAGR